MTMVALDARRRMYQAGVRGLQSLGPTFVKLGQISATRTDVISPDLCRELGRLHDSVTPMSRDQAERALRVARAREPRLAEVSVPLDPIASGSIASVYCGVLPDGRLVALKLKRPGRLRRLRAPRREFRAPMQRPPYRWFGVPSERPEGFI